MRGGGVFPFRPAPANATGWVQTLFPRRQQNGTATLKNTGVPGQVLSQHFEDLGRRLGRTYPGNFLTNQAPFTKPDATVVTIFCDSNKKYLSTDLLRDEPVRDGYLSPDVELLGFRALGRVCSACFDNDQRDAASRIVPVQR